MQKTALRLRALGVGLIAAAMLTACGGGGSDTSPPSPAPTFTAIPDNLSITAPTTAELATAVRFGNSTGTLAGLKYQWDFGDGGTGTEAAPTYSYAKGGEFDVVLKVTNEIGASREARWTIWVTDPAKVGGPECSGAAGTGWCLQYARSSARPTASFFLNANVGWFGDEEGAIYKTRDAGATWQPQRPAVPQNGQIKSIHFANASVGWAIDAKGTLLRTTDKGFTWTDRRLFANDNLRDVKFRSVDTNTVYLSFSMWPEDFFGTLASTDGGETWYGVPKKSFSEDLYLDSGGRFWHHGEKGISVSTDGGKNFANLPALKPPAGYSFSIFRRGAAAFSYDALRFSYVVAAYGQTAGDQITMIYTTADGGANWSSVVTDRWPEHVSADGQMLIDAESRSISADGGRTWAPNPAAVQPSSFAYFWLRSGNVVVTCDTRETPKFLLSEDDGRSWQHVGNPSSCDDEIHRRDASTLQMGWLLSTDNGRTWRDVLKPACYEASLAAFADAKVGFRTCDDYRTRDGGVTWQPWQHAFGKVRSLQFLDRSHGWLVDGDGRLHQSADAGETWLAVDTGAIQDFEQVTFSSEKWGWTSKRINGSSVALVTRDGGRTWRVALEGPVTSMHFGEQAWLALAAGGHVSVSTDQGITWTNLAPGGPYLHCNYGCSAIAFSNAKTAWAVGQGNGLAKSEDAGRTWTKVALPESTQDLKDIRFVDATVGWIVGRGGRILNTRDGGKTWTPQQSGTPRDLLTIHPVDGNTAWITTTNGGLLATRTGGN